MNVVSWENGQEELFDAVKEGVVESPNSFLKSVFLFSTLKTTTQVFFLFPFLLLLFLLLLLLLLLLPLPLLLLLTNQKQTKNKTIGVFPCWNL